MSLWWQIQIDPESRLLDRRFNERAAAAIAASEAWTEPRAAARRSLVLSRRRRMRRWCSGACCAASGSRAARDGKQIKDALERPLAARPDLTDAHFGIGALPLLRRRRAGCGEDAAMAALAAGRRSREGLREMLQARDSGELLRGEADYQLHLIYLWYEQKPARRSRCSNTRRALSVTTRSSSAYRRSATDTSTCSDARRRAARACDGSIARSEPRSWTRDERRASTARERSNGARIVDSVAAATNTCARAIAHDADTTFFDFSSHLCLTSYVSHP